MTDTKIKQFIACICLKDGRAAEGISDSRVISDDPVDLADSYAQQYVDGILVLDLSETDSGHAENISMLRQICGRVNLPVLCGGRIGKADDIKDIIYAGCRMAVLNFGRENNVSLAQDAAEKFGKDRIAAICRTQEDIEEHEKILEQCVSLLILPEGEKTQEKAQETGIPSVLAVKNLDEKTLLSAFSGENVAAVTGRAVNENAAKIRELRRFLLEHDFEVSARKAVFDWKDLKKGPDGLVPVVVQEAYTDKVLMVAYMDENAYRKTIETGKMTYFSRSRQKEWVKGETSGHFQYVRSLTLDCDLDTILARVDQVGAACHTGHHSCFFNTDLVLNTIEKHSPQAILETDYQTILDRKAHPKKGSYTNYLFDHGLDRMLVELGKENAELTIAAKGKHKDATVDEIADYLYHLMVVMAHEDITWRDVTEELARRAKDSDDGKAEE